VEDFPECSRDQQDDIRSTVDENVLCNESKSRPDQMVRAHSLTPSPVRKTKKTVQPTTPTPVKRSKKVMPRPQGPKQSLTVSDIDPSALMLQQRTVDEANQGKLYKVLKQLRNLCSAEMQRKVSLNTATPSPKEFAKLAGPMIKDIEQLLLKQSSTITESENKLEKYRDQWRKFFVEFLCNDREKRTKDDVKLKSMFKILRQKWSNREHEHEQIVKKLNNAMLDLKESNQSKTEEIENWAKKVNELNISKSNLEAARKKYLTQKAKDGLQQLAKVAREKAEMETELRELRLYTKEKETQLEERSNTVQALKSELEDVENNRTIIMDNLEQTEQQLHNVLQKHAILQSEYDEIAQALKKKNEKIAALKQEVMEKSDSLDSCNVELQRCQSNLVKNLSDFDLLRDQNSKNVDENKELQKSSKRSRSSMSKRWRKKTISTIDCKWFNHSLRASERAPLR
jgi:nuclear distribution protein NudE/nuclear distribution NudE-like protein 1